MPPVAETSHNRGWLAQGAAIVLVLLLALAAWRVLRDQPAAQDRAEQSLGSRALPAVTQRLARVAIHDSPLDGRGYRVLAQSMLSQGRKTEAAAIYSIAAARSPRDLQSQAWLVHRALAAGDYPEALSRLDLMLRVQPELSTQLFPVMVLLATQPAIQPSLAKILNGRPLWRQDFVRYLVSQAPDSSSVFGLIEGLRHASPGLSPFELAGWLDRLTYDRRWGAAYLTWVDSLPGTSREHIGNVFNGSFEDEPSRMGFDWRFERIPGARITRTQVTGADGMLALLVAFEDRRVPFQNVRQLLVLTPGEYRLSGRSRLDQLRSDRGLVWTVSCAEDGRTIAETEPFRGQHGWRTFQLQVTVPPVDCGGQWLTLRLPARIPAEQRIGGDAWFDALQMERLAGH